MPDLMGWWTFSRRLGRPTQNVVSLVRELPGEALAAFRLKRIDDRSGDQHRSVKRPAIGSDAAGNIERIADLRRSFERNRAAILRLPLVLRQPRQEALPA